MGAKENFDQLFLLLSMHNVFVTESFKKDIQNLVKTNIKKFIKDFYRDMSRNNLKDYKKYDKQELLDLIKDYYKETNSPKAKEILDHFDDYITDFKKIVPNDYAKVVKLIGHFEEQGISHENALMEAYKKVSLEG